MDQLPPSDNLSGSSDSSPKGSQDDSPGKSPGGSLLSSPSDTGTGLPEDSEKKYRTEEPKKNKGWLFGLGCVGCGLVGCLGTVVVSVALFFFGIFWFADNLLSKSPLEVPPVYLSEDEVAALEKKMAGFKSLTDQSKPATLELTDKELNYIFQKDPDKSEVRMHVTFNNDNTADFMVSILSKSSSGETSQQPLYMNMSGTGAISVTNGRFDTDFSKLKIGKIEIPGGDFLKGFSQGIGDEIDKNEQLQKLDYSISDLKISDGKMTVTVKPKKGASDDGDSKPSPEETPSPKSTDKTDDEEESGKGIKLD